MALIDLNTKKYCTMLKLEIYFDIDFSMDLFDKSLATYMSCSPRKKTLFSASLSTLNQRQEII